jgi:trigger factor
MAEESKDSGEGTTAVAEAHHDHAATGEGPKPLMIERDALTAEAAAKAAEDGGKPVVDLPYSVKSESALPHSVLSLGFEVPAQTVTSELERYYRDLRKEVALPGFRKGKAPVKLLRIRLGKDGDKEAMQEIAVNVARQEVVKRGLQLVGDAQIKSWSLEDGKALDFEILLELQPVVELKKYKGLTVEVERIEFKPEMVDAELEQLRKQHARQESAPAGAAVKAGDAIVADMTVSGQGGKQLDHLGRQNLMIRDFQTELPSELADQIAGRKVGESVSADIGTERRTRRGESVKHTDTYTLSIRDIKVTRVPELDDEFAKDLGEYDMLAELRAGLEKQIRERIEQSRKHSSMARIMQTLVENNPVDAPHSLIHQAQYRSLMNDSMQLARMGLRLEDVVQDSEAYMSSQHQQAEMLIKQGLLRAELAKIEKLEVSDEDVEKEIARLADEQGRKTLAVRARLEADKKLDALREELLDRRIVEFLIENNKVKEVEPKAAGEAEAAGDEDAEAEAKPRKAAKKPAAKKAAPKAKSDEEPKAEAEAKPAKKAAPKKPKKS